MPSGFIQQTDRSHKFRLLISGAPNSGKTTSLETCDRPLHIISCPGEKGTASLPVGEGIYNYIYQVDPEETIKDTTLAKKVISEVVDLTVKISAGAYGPCQTLAIDGLVKLYEWMLNYATGGSYLRADEFEAREYSKSHTRMTNYLSELYHSPVPYIIATTWDDWDIKQEDERDKHTKKDAPRYLYPMLPGKMSKFVLGEFDGTVHAHLEKRCSIKSCEETEDHFIWQLIPYGLVRGVGIKGMRKGTLPRYIHQDWPMLKKLLGLE